MTVDFEKGAASNSRAIDGASWAFDPAADVAALWGDKQDVLWADGEPLMICGPPGVGKTTLMQNLVLARIGVTGAVLGRAVTPGRRVLYIAADRPRQAARSLRRMVAESDRALLAERLVVWQGPLPFDLTRSSADALATFVQEHSADTVAIDSLKDIAVGLTDDTVGSKVNLAMQGCVARGIRPISAHHQRKAQGENKRPTKLDDVYGSTWLTAGCGSVILLWGQAGDPVVDLYHLKQPAGEVGPLSLLVDFELGAFTIREGTTALEIVRAATNGGVTVTDVAKRLFETTKPTTAQHEKARRQLEQLVTKDLAAPIRGDKPKDPVRYRPVDARLADPAVIGRDTDRDRSRTASRTITTPDETASREHHAPSRAPLDNGRPPIKGGRGEDRDTEPEDELDRLRAKFGDLAEGEP